MLGYFYGRYTSYQGQLRDTSSLQWARAKIVELTSSDNYQEWLEAERGGPLRSFDHRKISIQIDPTMPEGAVQIIRECFLEWESASDSGIQFIFLSLDPPYPLAGEREISDKVFDILVQRKESPGEGACGTTWIIGPETSGGIWFGPGQEGKISYADITLQFNLSTPEMLRGVVLHEIGHALFAEGHSFDPGDIMSCWGYDHSLPGLSARLEFYSTQS